VGARPDAASASSDRNDALATEDVFGPHAIPDTAAWRRLVSQSVQRYADPTTGDPLPLGEVGEVVLPYDVRVLVITTELPGDTAETNAPRHPSSRPRIRAAISCLLFRSKSISDGVSCRGPMEVPSF
jgi:hypothetical protein